MMKMTGAQVLADMLAGYGVTHVFMVPAVLRRTFAEMERRTSIQRIHTHGEKSAAYMADGYARELWTYRKVNFARIAEEMGALGLRVEKPAEFAPALASALAADRPVIIDVVTDIDALAPTAVA